VCLTEIKNVANEIVDRRVAAIYNIYLLSISYIFRTSVAIVN